MPSLQEFRQQLPVTLTAATTLHKLLTDEFNALEREDLALFQRIQQQKQPLMQQLQSFDQTKTAHFDNCGIDPAAPPTADANDQDHWQQLLETLSLCKNQHRKTYIYISRRLEVIHSALELLRVNNPSNSTSLYDKLGKKAVSSLRRKLDEA